MVFSFCGLTAQGIKRLKNENADLKNQLKQKRGDKPTAPESLIGGRCTRNMSEEQIKGRLDHRSITITATEILRMQKERAAEQNAVMQATAERIAEVMLAPLINCALEREADKVSKLMGDIKLLQNSEAALKNEVAILQGINIESAGQIIELEERNAYIEEELTDMREALGDLRG